MPSTIPYDPSLVLANIVDPKLFEYLQQMSNAQAPADAAEDVLHGLLSTRRSLDMTRLELQNLNIQTDDIDAAISDLSREISVAAKDYARKKGRRYQDGFRNNLQKSEG